jgi:hypothetical protein
MTTLSPVSRGTCADQLVVPQAVPEPPVDVVHCTAATPTLSDAVPVTVSHAADVLTIVEPGEVIRREGGAASVLVAGVVGVGAGVTGVRAGVAGVCAGGVMGIVPGGNKVTGGVTGETGDVTVGSVGGANGGVNVGVDGEAAVGVAGGITATDGSIGSWGAVDWPLLPYNARIPAMSSTDKPVRMR